MVTFKSGKSYRYTQKNVEWFSRPEPIPVQDVRFSIAGNLLSDVGEAFRFGKWIKIFHRSGGSRCCMAAALTVQPMRMPDGRSKDVLAYYRELAEGAPLKTAEEEALMAMKYRHMDCVPWNSILSRFLQNRPPDSTTALPAPLIFPFGCNMSQKAAVTAALQNHVSLIQGPPGTGKTQTILNLIANLLLQGKKIAVVSSNNSATGNVLEKLEKHQLAFIAAFLGSAQNKKAFIDSQKNSVIDMPSLPAGRESLVREELVSLNRELDEGFRFKNELASIRQKLDSFRLESAHYEKFLKEMEGPESKVRLRKLAFEASSRKVLDYWLAFERMAESEKSRTKEPSVIRYCSGLLRKIRLLMRFGINGRAFFELRAEECISMLRREFYRRKIEELENERNDLSDSLEGFRFEERQERLTNLSMDLLKHHLARRFNERERKRFDIDDLSLKTEEFLAEYPVVLSTTFSVITTVESGYLFDCVIVDEASQVDLLTGVLAMRCAKSFVIVGDPMQLPNVLTEQEKRRAEQVVSKYDLPEHFRFERHNLLSAARIALPGMPEILLREHYRCHPKIIGFCNAKFYGGKLLVMTSDLGESDAIKVYVTVEGRHARGNLNQRQIDEIVENVFPELEKIDPADIGIVSPYRAQVARMKSTIHSADVLVDTVHKFQGREKRAMAITMVSNDSNEFVDNPNLLNVAISRAREKVCLVVSKEMAEGKGNIADFVRYIRYNNFEVVPGKVRSVFDLLYREYTESRLNLLAKRKRISEYDSENLVYGEIEAILQQECYQGFGVVSQFPLSMLVKDAGFLTSTELSYASHPWTRTDFLIYRKVDKNPVLAVEVDGHAFHREGTRQAERDRLKNAVLMKCGLPLLRLSTIGSNERCLIEKKLNEVAGGA